MVYKTLRRKQAINQSELHQKRRVISSAPEWQTVPTTHVTHIMIKYGLDQRLQIQSYKKNTTSW